MLRSVAVGCVALVAAAVAASASGSARAAACSTAGLVVWLNTQGDGAAGSIYYTLEFTNLSGHLCTLRGYPGVSALDLEHHQLGSPAGRNPHVTPRTVRLAAGATATAVLQITEAGNFPAATCRRLTAAGLRVYPPNQTGSQFVPFPFSACSRSGPVVLHVEAAT